MTISWNTDATDVDLWVIEPDGTKCFYQHNRTDERRRTVAGHDAGLRPRALPHQGAKPGTYRVLVHYFSANPNLLAGETHVNVVVTRHADSPRKTIERHSVVLSEANQQVEVTKVGF